MVGISLLILTVWWVRKLGAASMMGSIATILNFVLRPGALHFLEFTAASIIFDVSTRVIGYRISFERRIVSYVAILIISLFSALVAGFIIGNLFMSLVYLSNMWRRSFLYSASRGWRSLGWSYRHNNHERNRSQKNYSMK